MAKSLRSRLKSIVRYGLGERGSREIHARLWAWRLRGLGEGHEPKGVLDGVRPGDVCIDIGAHGGSLAVLLARRAGANGHVFAIEAVPYYATVLERAFQILGVENVTVISVAVGDTRRMIRMVTHADGQELTGRTHVAPPEALTTGGEMNGVEALMVPLADLITEHPDMARAGFVKIDVEGAELQVLRGAGEFFSQSPRAVYCEVQDEHCRRYGHSKVDVLQMFEMLGFVGQQITEVDMLFERQTASAAETTDARKAERA